MINRRKISSTLRAIASNLESTAATSNNPAFQKFVQDWIQSDIHGFCEFMEDHCQEEMHEMHFGIGGPQDNLVYVLTFDGGDWWVEDWSIDLLSTPQLQAAKSALLEQFSKRSGGSSVRP